MWDRKAHRAPRRLSRAETSGAAANMRTAGWPLTTGWFWHLHIRHIVCYFSPLDCSISASMRKGMCISAQSLHTLLI